MIIKESPNDPTVMLYLDYNSTQLILMCSTAEDCRTPEAARGPQPETKPQEKPGQRRSRRGGRRAPESRYIERQLQGHGTRDEYMAA